ncbi:hypothetical protein L226DRAFT_617610 [Lentinus tigrinus ALCF2SS1-7]|uniref:Uncharacterized protein n=1 Tax=Lentinus tigrinus ALCF2SS1-6 TaxID=1328759 RepID=A0A5C2RPM1_9APHY|nr:hypothetical protein L227DRAFT_617286 [Lentinus tigrinus ALCF2SS1-6]RPD68289.1 hypothetical protein L226DRAFT_617610 [Lentinus tigrinus ALCF2SS1-7]
MVSLKKASVFSTFQAMLYGFSVLMFMLIMWILAGHRHKRRHNMLAAPCGLFVLSTAIYSAYVVWQSISVVALPILAWSWLLVAVIGTNFTTLIQQAGSPFNPQVVPWIRALYTLDLSTNFLATALLAYRLWVVVRGTARWSSRSGLGLAPVLRVVIESGAIYSATVGAGMILFLTQSNAVFILMDITSPIISIVFNMIVVRVGLAQERSSRDRHTKTTQQTSSSFVAVVTQLQNQDRPTSAGAEIELDDVSVKITRLLEELESPEDAAEQPGRQDEKPVGLGPRATS